jgi:phosphoglycolate phosphatase
MTATRPRAILFDLDGTLVDTLHDITASFRHAVSPYDIGPVSEEMVRPLVSAGARRLIAQVVGPRYPNALTDILTRFRDHYNEHCLDASILYTGVSAALDILAACSIPMAVLSNKPHAPTNFICNALLSRWPFVAFVGQQDGLPLKPDPAQAVTLCERMGCSPSEVLLVGDSPVDMETACRGGLIPVAVAWGFGEPTELRAAGAKVVLDDPSDLPTLVV